MIPLAVASRLPSRVTPRRVARQVTVPAPVGGWNRRDALDNMPLEDAILLDNWFPDIGKVSVRGGYAGHATGVGAGDVKTLAEYHAGSTRTLIAAGGGSIFDASAVGAATSLASGFTENRWQWVNFNGSMGLVNGTDAPQVYNGSTVAAMTLTGPTANNVIGIAVHKSRSYFWEDDSQDFWYSAINALGGTVTRFPLSRVGRFGGNLVAAAPWNIRGGSASFAGSGIVDDFMVFVMSSGDVIVYEGDDPGSNWSLVGVYRVGAPLDARGVVRIGGDLVIMTIEGYVSMAKVVSQGIVTPDGMISDKISQEVNTVATQFQSNVGWECHYFPRGHFVLFNVPVSTTRFDQHVMNARTGAWCRFLNLDARCWGLFNDNLMFGDGAGNVRQADTGNTDNGATIFAEARTAQSYVGDRGAVKRITALRPVLEGNGTPEIGLSAEIDFAEAPSCPRHPYQLGVAEDPIDLSNEQFDTSNYVFNDASNIVPRWLGAIGAGYSVGAKLAAEADDDLAWHSLAYQLEPGFGIV